MKRILSTLLALLCIISIPLTAFAVDTRITLGKKDVSSNNAVLYATIENPSKATITDVGITLTYNGKVLKTYTEKCAASYKNKASVPIWYNLKDEVKFPLDGNTEYQYTFFAVVGGKRHEASDTFKTSGKASSVTLQKEKNKYSQTNAVLYATINNPNQIEASKAGIIIRQENTVVKDYSENVVKDYRRSKSIPVWYDLNKELGVALTPGTEYSYEVYCVIGGIRRSAAGTFDTEKASNATISYGAPENDALANNRLVITYTKPSITAVKVGTIRYVAQGGDMLDKDAWPKSVTTSAGCIAAAKSMALSSLGIDHLPKDMALSGNGWVDDDRVAQFKLKQLVCGDNRPAEERSDALYTYLCNYISDPVKYSPPVIRVSTYNGNHSMLVVGLDDYGYRVVDSGSFGWDHFRISSDGSVSQRGDSMFVSPLIGVFQYVKN